MRKKLLIASMALASSTSMATNIALDDGRNITINGFANIVGGQTLDKGDVFLAEAIAGGVYDDDYSFSKESIFGLKSTINFSDKFSFTAQVIGRSANDFNAEVDRAYVTYQMNQNWQISAGKKNLIFFQYSDYLDVSYAYNFMRPPTPVYILPFGSYEGASTTYTNYIGDYDFSIEAYMGNTIGVDVVSLSAFNAKLTFDLQNIYGVVFNLTAEDWSARIGGHVFDLQSNLVGDVEALDLSDGDALIDDKNHASWVSGGVSYTPGNLVMNYEFFFYRDDLGFNSQDSHFVNIGYQMGNWTPTVSWSNAKEAQNKTHMGAPIGINKGAPITDYSTLGLTLRYEVQANVAMKVDVTKYNDDGDTLTFSDSTVVSAGIYLTF
jgi:hypothetical protein